VYLCSSDGAAHLTVDSAVALSWWAERTWVRYEQLPAGCSGVEVAVIDAAATTGGADVGGVVVSWWRDAFALRDLPVTGVVPSAIGYGENSWKTLKPVDIHQRRR
jgi:hypothetical protein